MLNVPAEGTLNAPAAGPPKPLAEGEAPKTGFGPVPVAEAGAGTWPAFIPNLPSVGRPNPCAAGAPKSLANVAAPKDVLGPASKTEAGAGAGS